MYIPAHLADVSQGWLETVLCDGLALPAFELQPLEASNSTTARLVFVDDPLLPNLHQSVILKLCPTGHAFLGASEPNYYCRDYKGLSAAPIPRCYRAVWPGAATPESLGNGYALFLEDLSADYSDHKQIEPVDNHAAKLGHALALLHAHRWGRDADPDGLHDLNADFERFLSHVSDGLGPICNALGASLDEKSRARLIRVFDTDADLMLQRALSGQGLTLVHGDPNPTNVMTRKTSHRGRPPLYLIDRQPFQWSLRLWLGASDLVYAVVPFWPEKHRRALQGILLRNYHQTLLASGVQDYSWEDLLRDWKACACMAVFTAIEWGADPASLKGMKWLWERQLRRSLAFLDDCDAD